MADSGGSGQGGGERTSVANVWVKCGQLTADLAAEKRAIQAFSVEMDQQQPTMCTLTVDNSVQVDDVVGLCNAVHPGDELEIRIGGESGTTIFKGEISGMDPRYEMGADTKLVIRAFDRMHRMLRGPVSQTYTDKRDSDIAKLIAERNGLTANVEETEPVYPHVYQVNTPDLVFLRQRAAMNHYNLSVAGTELNFTKPKPDHESGIDLRLNDAEAEFQLRKFAPRLNTAGQVQKVEVRAWDATKKEAIVESATPGASRLGNKTGAQQSEHFGSTTSITVDETVSSSGEAKRLAQAKLDEAMMNYITGSGIVHAKDKNRLAELMPGIVVKVTVNTEQEQDRFNGKYMVTGATHKYTQTGTVGSGQQGGYTVAVRIARDADGL